MKEGELKWEGREGREGGKGGGREKREGGREGRREGGPTCHCLEEQCASIAVIEAVLPDTGSEVLRRKPRRESRRIYEQ